jgi:hypothetical protein
MQQSEIYYLNLPAGSADQVTSLVSYLKAHGIEAAEDYPDDVICPIDPSRPAQLSLIHDLHRHWRRFWEHSDSELYGIPLYVKPADADTCAECISDQV